MSIRILITDDHSIFIDGITALLDGIPGMEVVGRALNGQQAIELALDLQPDIILMDIQMPVMNGIEATREISSRVPGAKVIALSMLNESLNTRKMLEAGAYGYVLKTIDKGELVQVLEKVSSGQKHFSAEVTEQLMNNFAGRASSPAGMLSRREKEILVHIAQGLTDKEIAEKVFLSPHTVIAHRKNILSKLGLKNKVEITRFAMDNGLLP